MNRFALSMILLAGLSACGSDAESREDLDSQAIDRQTAERPARAGAAPAEVATPAEPVRAIPAGTILTFEVRENVSTSSHVSGDAFSLVLVDAVSGAAGAALTAGTSARGVVTHVHKSTGPEDDAILGVRIASVEAGGGQKAIEGEVRSTEIEASTRDSGTRTAATIATGTAAGAIIGQILGGDTRSTVTGAAVGTAVGVAVALTTRGGDATLPAGSRIVVRLDRDLVY